ncbi:hypothetical protein F8B43_3932 [Methylorubrum populi]|uniref:Uncharacterized protein n=1 Tax=Methylorubrum populi TaxID=223967 RepID=A0A833J4G2_9HYPH|nr:hypothetical protein F8B43_3932 [Methylorubrum populi]
MSPRSDGLAGTAGAGRRPAASRINARHGPAGRPGTERNLVESGHNDPIADVPY